MSKTKIEWCDFSINPVKGLCPMACSYCYARKLYKRFHWDEKISWYPPAWDVVDKVKEPSKFFVGSTFELFHSGLSENWMEYNLLTARKYPQHTFTFLTKLPQNLIRWTFPDNCWVGVSTTGNDCRSGLEDIFREIDAKVKFVSIEPLLDYTPMDFRWVDWVIIGAQTPNSIKTQPQLWWVKDIVKYCDRERKPVFLKNNLAQLFNVQKSYADISWGVNDKGLRQEFPKC